MTERQPSGEVRKADVDYEGLDISLKVLYDTRDPIKIYLHRNCYVGKMSNLAVEKKSHSELYIRIKTTLAYWQGRGKRVTNLRVVIFCSPNVTERGLEGMAKDMHLKLCNGKRGDRTNHSVNHLYIMSFLFEDSPEGDRLGYHTLPSQLHTRHPNMSFSEEFFRFLEDFHYGRIRIYLCEERFAKHPGIERLCEIPTAEDMRLVIRRRELDALYEQFCHDGDSEAFLDAIVYNLK